jgi:hypothetical protein
MSTETAKGWDTESVYTVIRNKTKNSKIVLSALGGVEIAPGHTLDLRTQFKKAQVADASHEIFSLIKTGHLEDLADGAEIRTDINKTTTDQLQDEVRGKIRDSAIREISGSSSLGQLEDFLKHKDAAIAKAAQVRIDTLMGLRDDNGDVIPGSEEELSKPTETIRSLSAGEIVSPGAQK